MTEVYTLQITYRGCADQLWRTIEISSNSTLAQLGYTILATFDASAMHLFQISCQGVTYDLDSSEEPIDPPRSLTRVKLSSLNLQIGDQLEMIYDFSCNQVFNIILTHIQDMLRGHGRAYPKILAGQGRGIIDGTPANELATMIAEIDRTGKSPFWYICSLNRRIPWDYRDYHLDYDNELDRCNYKMIQEAYELQNPD